MSYVWPLYNQIQTLLNHYTLTNKAVSTTLRALSKIHWRDKMLSFVPSDCFWYFTCHGSKFTDQPGGVYPTFVDVTWYFDIVIIINNICVIYYYDVSNLDICCSLFSS